MTIPRFVHASLPSWVSDVVSADAVCASREDRMRLAVRLSRENVERGTGGPFGAAVFERASGRVIAVGVNLVVAQRNSLLHAEVVAIMMAERRLRSRSLAHGAVPYELAASSDPCVMCLGAVLWSGVGRLVSGADREDVRAIGFEEGPAFAEAWEHAAERGLDIERGVLREEARAVLELYRARGGEVYNG